MVDGQTEENTGVVGDINDQQEDVAGITEESMKIYLEVDGDDTMRTLSADE